MTTLTNDQITAGAAVLCDHGQPIGRNAAIEVFDAMKLEQQLRAMRAAFHANMLRAFPNKTHAEIAAEIDRATASSPQIAEVAELRERLCDALIKGGHMIEQDAVTLYRSSVAEGNAFSQVLDRLVLAAQPAERAAAPAEQPSAQVKP